MNSREEEPARSRRTLLPERGARVAILRCPVLLSSKPIFCRAYRRVKGPIVHSPQPLNPGVFGKAPIKQRFSFLFPQGLTGCVIMACAGTKPNCFRQLWACSRPKRPSVLLSVLAVARFANEHDTMVRRIGTHYVYSARPKVLFATLGKGAATIAAFADVPHAHGADPAAITAVNAEMSQAFFKGITASPPNAALTFDGFHVVSLVKTGVDEIRYAEQKTSPHPPKPPCMAQESPES